MVLGQNRAVLVASVICFQKIYGLHGVKHQIIEYSKKEKVITDKRTNGQTEFPHVDSTPSTELRFVTTVATGGRVKFVPAV